MEIVNSKSGSLNPAKASISTLCLLLPPFRLFHRTTPGIEAYPEPDTTALESCGLRNSHDYGKENISLNNWNHLITIVSRASLLPWLNFIRLTLTFILHFLSSRLAPIFAFSLYFWASSPGWHHTGYGNCSSLFIWLFQQISTECLLHFRYWFWHLGYSTE